MTIGERIKKIRVFRKMTMDDLGGALGFEGKNMSVRISPVSYTHLTDITLKHFTYFFYNCQCDWLVIRHFCHCSLTNLCLAT